MRGDDLRAGLEARAPAAGPLFRAEQRILARADRIEGER